MYGFQKKVLPDPRTYPVLPPDMDYVYFEGAKSAPFKPEQTEYSPVNAWWLAESSFLAYTHPGFARMAFKLAGLDGFQFLGGTATECMIAWNDDLAIVAFRGTEMKSLSALREIRTDLNTILQTFPEGGRVHKGFYKALEEIWEGPAQCRLFLESLSKKQPGRPVWFTGHSLGGALASLAFARMPFARGLYVFGSPRVGDQAFAELTLKRPVWRVENAKDPITLLPPDVPALGLNFVPIGTLVHIAKDGRIKPDRPVFDFREQGEKAGRTLSKQIARVAAIMKRSRKATGRADNHGMIARYVEGTRAAYAELDSQIHESILEWREYLDEIENTAGIRLEDHMPIFYASRLWNNLVEHGKD
jgi:triacylglycerol lipase